MLSRRPSRRGNRKTLRQGAASRGRSYRYASSTGTAESSLKPVCDLSHRNCKRLRLEVIVVDNASTDGAAEMVARAFPRVVLVRNADNVGFARANNQAARLARGRYLFFLNNDTVVPPGALRRLVEYARAHPEIGLLGPRMRDRRGRTQVSCRRRPTVAALLHRTILLRWTGCSARAYRRYRSRDAAADQARPVEVLMGAALLTPARRIPKERRLGRGVTFRRRGHRSLQPRRPRPRGGLSSGY